MKQNYHSITHWVH